MEDRITRLPDDILATVIRKLTLKEAVRTCVLSHRWKNMWGFANRLNFDASERRLLALAGKRPGNFFKFERRKYARWVNQVMENHQGSDLDEVIIKFEFRERYSLDLNNWITLSLTKRVKALTIDLWPTQDYFSTRKYSFMFECPTSLYLCYVDITEEIIQQFLAVCPLLERLSLYYLDGFLNLRVGCSLLKLKYLDIHRYDTLDSIEEICSPNIVSFGYAKMSLKTKLQFQSLPCLVELHLGKDVYDTFHQFSSYSSQLETLRLDPFRYSKKFYELLGLSQFKNLRHLTLKMTVTLNITLVLPSAEEEQSLKVMEMVKFDEERSSIEFIRCFLKLAIKLEKLIVDTCCRKPGRGTEKELKRIAKMLKTEMPCGVELHVI